MRVRGGCPLAWGLLAAACQPGLAVDLYNAGSEEVLLVAVDPAGTRREEVLPPGSSGTLGGALSYHVVAGDGSWAVELVHPGEAHASRTFRGRYSVGYRFQVEDRCVIVLGPDEQPPVARAAPQPPGYPLGPSGSCRLPATEAPRGERRHGVDAPGPEVVDWSPRGAR